MGVAIGQRESSALTRRRRSRQARASGLAVAVILAVGCDATTVTPPPAPPGASPEASASADASATSRPATSAGPVRTAGPGGVLVDEPLPRPTLEEPFAIGAALYDPTQTAAAVVSLLSLMGVGITAPDGAVLLQGVDNGAGLLRVSEAEARGLIEMTEADLETEGPLTTSVADLYAALAPSLPPDHTVGDFADAYDRAYAADPGSLVAQVMLGQPITPETELLRVQLWLLLIDGFAQPAATAALVSATAAARPRLGAARPFQPPSTPQIPGMSAAHWTELLVALPTLAFRVPFVIHASGSAHEGHGRLGDRVDFEATLGPPAPLVASDGRTILLQAGLSPGLSITWDSRNPGVLAAHGSLSGNIRTPVALSQAGTAGIAYTPKREDADGRGTQVTEIGDLHASVDQYELVSRAFSLGGADATARGLISGRRKADTIPFAIAWHEPNYIAFGILNVYEFSAGVAGGPDLVSTYRKGKDLTIGTLYRRSDGSWHGSALVTTDSQAVGEAFLGLAGVGRCNDKLRSRQQLAVTGTVVGNELHLRFYPGGSPEVLEAENVEEPLAPLGPQQFPLCQPVIPFPGGAGFAPGSYVPINDTRWSIPDMGYHLDLPSAGQLVNGTDSTQVGVHRDVCSVFYIVTYRSDPNQQPTPTPPPTTPVATPGECDQTSPP